MAKMAAKFGGAPFACSCCDRGGHARRMGKKAAKAKEKKAWTEAVRKGEA